MKIIFLGTGTSDGVPMFAKVKIKEIKEQEHLF